MKTEGIVLEAVSESFIGGEHAFTQSEISKRVGVAVSAVNKTINNLKRLSIVDIGRRNFRVIDFKRLLLYWATHRNLDRDVVYSTHVDIDIGRIESSMPPDIAFTAFTAFKFIVGEPPADYSQVYVYSSAAVLGILKERFPQKKGTKNLFVLKADRYLEKKIAGNELKDSCVSLAQAFVDLWNVREWYAKEFTERLMDVLAK